MKNWRQILTIGSLWALANVVAVVVIDWYERTSLEEQLGLRSGILSEFESREISVETGAQNRRVFRYRVYVPDDIGDGEKFPVVLYLHGAGERGADNAKQLRSVPSRLTSDGHRSRFRSVIVVPQCPKDGNWTQFRNVGKETDVVLAILNDVALSTPIDNRRIYLIGYSMGSFGAWELAADFPQRFSAVVPISGGSSDSLSEQLTEIPIWTVHGAKDETCPVEATRRLVQAIRDKGGTIRYTELPETGHRAWAHSLGDHQEILDWLFRQKKNHP